MGLNFLLLTSDATLLKIIQSVLAVTVGLHLRTDAASAHGTSARRRLDGFVIDCDDVSWSSRCARQDTQQPPNKQSVIVAS